MTALGPSSYRNGKIIALMSLCVRVYQVFFTVPITIFIYFFILDPSGGEESQRKVRTLYACVGEHESELNFEPNQVITDGKFLKK